MQVEPADILNRAIDSPLVNDQMSTARFAQVLNEHQDGANAPQHLREQRAYEAAQQLVSTAFVQPMLDQMKDDPFRSDMFHAGLGEDIFQQQMNTTIAERVVKSAQDGSRLNSPKMPLVDAIYRNLVRKTQQLPGVNVNG
jgi:Rod binding domain-containing protein